MSEALPELIETDPWDQLGVFVDANNNLVKAALVTHQQPSAEALALTYESKKMAVVTLTPIIASNFFNESKDKELVSSTMHAIVSSTTRLWETASAIRPDEPSLYSFDLENEDEIIDVVLSEESLDSDGVIPTVGTIGNIYEEAVQDLFDKLMTGDKITDYSAEIDRRAERRKQFINFGVIGTAAFLGVGLANIVTRKIR